jgi:hypothetical protein
MALWSAKPRPMPCSRPASEITATILSSRGTRRSVALARGSRLHLHSRIRRLRSFASSRPSGITTRRASVPVVRERSTGGLTRPITSRSRTSVGQPTRAEPPSSLRRRCSGRPRQPRSGAPTAQRGHADGLADRRRGHWPAVTNSFIACWDAKHMFWRQ